ncbi:hypothetical protein [Hydrocarboniphaga sp.]|uniref:hypothetical protein n=1 Tax=Hydrocarboniphaga sp. TaxID=2033016 RepID=UPI00262A094A|nr:hypothetical protein [Hydrocarboniphaga sp.]
MSHTEATAAIATEPGLAVHDGHFQRGTRVFNVSVFGTLMKARAHPDSGITSDDFECVPRGSKGDKAALICGAMAEDIVLQFPQSADDFGCHFRGKSSINCRLICSTCPERPLICCIAVASKNSEREHAYSCVTMGAADGGSGHRGTNELRERRCDNDIRVDRRIRSSSHFQFYERTDAARPRKHDFSDGLQFPGLSGPQQVIGARKVAN